MKPLLCYVCKKEIKPALVKNIGKYKKQFAARIAVWNGNFVKRSSLPFYVGNDTWRHVSCEPGSPKWMRWQQRKRGKKSEIYQDFLVEEICK
jgi:hypothetical protein